MRRYTYTAAWVLQLPFNTSGAFRLVMYALWRGHQIKEAECSHWRTHVVKGVSGQGSDI